MQAPSKDPQTHVLDFCSDMAVIHGIDWIIVLKSNPVSNAHSGVDYLPPDHRGAGGVRLHAVLWLS